MCNTHSTTTEPLSCRDWNTYAAETLALMAELQTEYPRLSDRDAHACASAFVDTEMEAFTADWDLMVAQFADSEPEPEPEPEPPTPATVAAQERAMHKAAYHLAGGLDVRFGPDGSAYVPSGTRGGTVHRVDTLGRCSCEAAQHGRACWHIFAVDALLDQNDGVAA